MKKKVKDIAQIHTGIYSKTINSGDVYYIQSRHFNEKRELLSSVKPELLSDPKLQNHYLIPGDILIAAKGYDNFAVLYEGKIGLAVASSTFIITRLKDQNLILPEFLTWFINHFKTQQIIQGSAKGTALPSISKSVIGELEIPILPLNKQETILKIHKLSQKEKQIKEKMIYLQESIIQQQLLNALK